MSSPSPLADVTAAAVELIDAEHALERARQRAAAARDTVEALVLPLVESRGERLPSGCHHSFLLAEQLIVQVQNNGERLSVAVQPLPPPLIELPSAAAPN